MTPITPQDAAEALNILADTALQRQKELRDYANVDAPTESDDEADSSSPIFNFFHTSGGSKVIGDMINFFTPRVPSFMVRNMRSCDCQVECWKRPKSYYTGKDVLFMMLTTVKHGEHW